MSTLTPTSLERALARLADQAPGTVLLAGGTDFNVQRRKGLPLPARVLYIGALPELRGIGRAGEYLRLGALTTFAELTENNLLRAHVPGLCAALADFASPPVRSLATLGGNIANGSPTADSLPPLLVRGATLELASVRGTRVLPLAEYYTGYKRSVLAPDELIAAVRVPLNAEQNLRSFYRKVGSRRALIIAKLSLAGVGRVEEGRVVEVRLAAGALNEYPRRLAHVEALTKEVPAILLCGWYRDALQEALAGDVSPITDLRSDAEYRFETCLNLLQACLRDWSEHA